MEKAYVVYANYHGCEPEWWWEYKTERQAQIGVDLAREGGMDAFYVEEEI